MSITFHVQDAHEDLSLNLSNANAMALLCAVLGEDRADYSGRASLGEILDSLHHEVYERARHMPGTVSAPLAFNAGRLYALGLAAMRDTGTDVDALTLTWG